MRRRPGRRLQGWTGLLVIVVALLFMAFNRRGLMRLHKLKAEQKQLELEIASLEARATGLMIERAHLESDFAYIERLAREKYRMVRRGEKVFRVMEEIRPVDREAPANPPQ
ncbi:MAG: septum formation initiator family protein [Candidatus Neomarinimicrobiota bacterium]